MPGEMDIIRRVTAADALPAEPVAKNISSVTQSTETIENILIRDIRKADAKLTEELKKEKFDLINVVKQMGKIQAMLARMSVETYGATINSRTDELEEIVVKLQATYQTRNWTWILHGSSFTLQIFAAAAGLGFLGNSVKVGASMISGVGDGLQKFAQIHQNSIQSQQTLLNFIMDENKRWRNNSAEASQRSLQDLREALAAVKKAAEEKEQATNQASRLGG